MRPLTVAALAVLGIGAQAQQLVHFHHVHLNSTNPDVASSTRRTSIQSPPDLEA